jgi:ribosome hibernation promoting factor
VDFMKIEYTGRQTEVVPALKRLTERKLRKLARVLRGIVHVHVILSSDKHRQVAEVTIQSRHLTLAATEETSDLGASLADALDKLARQAEKHVAKLRQKRRRLTRASAPAAPKALPPAAGPRIIRARRFVAKPMTLDEAALEMGSVGEGLLVFRDAATERVNVLYRRKDGNLGLIEPEA